MRMQPKEITSQYCKVDHINLSDVKEGYVSIMIRSHNDKADFWINKDESIELIEYLKAKFKL